MSNQSLKITDENKEAASLEVDLSTEQSNPMKEYYQLELTLLLGTIVLMSIIFLPVWYFCSLKVALNYLLGAAIGVVYLKLLAKDVERLGQQKKRLGTKGLALFAGLMIVTMKWQQLQVIPVFLGFLTYKLAVIFYLLQTSLIAAKNEE